MIKFEFPVSSQVKIEIYDLLGRKIETLVDTRFDAGYYDITWDASNEPSGVYFYRLKTGEFSETKKMMLLK